MYLQLSFKTTAGYQSQRDVISNCSPKQNLEVYLESKLACHEVWGSIFVCPHASKVMPKKGGLEDRLSLPHGCVAVEEQRTAWSLLLL